MSGSTSPLEEFWDNRVRQDRVSMERRYQTAPMSLSVVHRMGTAHPLNPAQPWFRWSRVHALVVDLMTNPKFTMVVGVDPGAP